MRSMRGVFVAGILAASSMLGQGGFDGPGRYEIANIESGKLLQVDRREQTTLVQASPTGTDNQRWDIEAGSPGFYLIRNAINGRALQLFRNSNKSQMVVARPDGNRAQQWRIEGAGDGAMIVSSFGWAIDVPDGSRNENLRLQVYDKNGEGNQRFALRRVGGGGGFGDRGRGPDFGDRGSDRGDDRSGQADRNGRFWDGREQMWKVAGDGVCFYTDPNFRGDALCTRVGVDVADAVRQFNGTFLSVRFFGSVRAIEVFESPGFRGRSYRLMRDQPDLRRGDVRGRDMFGVGSFRVN